MAKVDTKATKCTISRKEFVGKAKPIVVKIGDGNQLMLTPKEFSTGSFGWGASEKVVLTIDGEPVKVQASINFTVVGSKDA